MNTQSIETQSTETQSIETQSTETQSTETQRAGATDPRVERTAEAAGHIVEAAVDVGRVWASYGLRVGKLALEAHALTMGKLAGALGELNRAIDERHEARDASSTSSAQT